MSKPPDPLHDSDPNCTVCGHVFSPHAIIATSFASDDSADPMKGGIILCPEGGCQCFATWGANGGKTAYVPDADEIAQLRERIQRV